MLVCCRFTVLLAQCKSAASLGDRPAGSESEVGCGDHIFVCSHIELLFL